MLAGYLLCCLAIGSGYMSGNTYNINLSINNVVINEVSDGFVCNFDYEIDFYNFDGGYSPITFIGSDFIQHVSIRTYQLDFDIVVANVSMFLEESTYTAYCDLSLNLYCSTLDIDNNSEAFSKSLDTRLSVPYRSGTVERVYTRYLVKHAGSGYFYDYDLIFSRGYFMGSEDAAAIYNADWLGWIGQTLSSIMDIELFMGFTLGGIFGTCIIVAIAIWFLKMFTGG